MLKDGSRPPRGQCGLELNEHGLWDRGGADGSIGLFKRLEHQSGFKL